MNAKTAPSEFAQYALDARLVRRATGALPFAMGRHGRTLRPVVAYLSTGRDCDGFRFSKLYYATPEMVEREIESEYEWADGPLSVRILTRAEWAEMARASRAYQDAQRREMNERAEG